MAILFYAAATIVALILAGAAQLGWGPDVTPVWDSRAFFVVEGAGLFSGLAASAMLGGLLSLRLKSLRLDAVALAPMILFGALFSGVQTLSAGSSGPEVGDTAGVALLAGVAAAALVMLVGFAASFLPSEKASAETASKKKGRPKHLPAVLIILGIWVVAAALVLWPRRPDNGHIAYRADFAASCGTVSLIALKLPLIGETGAVFVVSDGRRANQLALDHEDLSHLQQLWSSSQGGDGKWRGGVIDDHEPSDPARLRLSVGPVARFEVSSKRGPSITCDLPASKFAQFGTAIDQVATLVKE